MTSALLATCAAAASSSSPIGFRPTFSLRQDRMSCEYAHRARSGTHAPLHHHTLLMFGEFDMIQACRQPA